MAVTVADFRARFPEFGDNTGDFPDARVTLALADALLNMNVYAWGLRADMGQVYMAAHLLAIEGDAFGGIGGTSFGAVTQESVGEISRSFAAPSGALTDSDGDLLWTKYGMVFSRLKRNIVSTPIVL